MKKHLSLPGSISADANGQALPSADSSPAGGTTRVEAGAGGSNNAHPSPLMQGWGGGASRVPSATQPGQYTSGGGDGGSWLSTILGLLWLGFIAWMIFGH
jgi:hypothetical protein